MQTQMCACVCAHTYVYTYICIHMGFPGGSAVKESTCNAGATGGSGSVPVLGRSPAGGHGNLLQYSCLENLMDWGIWQAIVHRVAKIKM